VNEALVSIVIPYYNKKDTIGRSLNSVLAQNYQHWELIIIDDCGNEKLDIGQVPKDNRISILYNDKNLGAAETRQRGLDESKGEYIAFLDADDWWDENFLIYCLASLNDNVFADGAYVKTNVINADGIITLRRYCDKGFTNIRETLIQYGKPWQTGGILWKKMCCGNWGKLKTQEDSWFEIKSSKFNVLIPVSDTFYYHDETGDNHLSIYNGNFQSTLDQQELFLMIYSDCWSKIAIKYKVILMHRLLRGQLKIMEYCSKVEILEYNSKLLDKLMLLGMISKSRIMLKIMHRIMQNSPFKIHF